MGYLPERPSNAKRGGCHAFSRRPLYDCAAFERLAAVNVRSESFAEVEWDERHVRPTPERWRRNARYKSQRFPHNLRAL
jgi:hypothetical protein